MPKQLSMRSEGEDGSAASALELLLRLVAGDWATCLGGGRDWEPPLSDAGPAGLNVGGMGSSKGLRGPYLGGGDVSVAGDAAGLISHGLDAWVSVQVKTQEADLCEWRRWPGSSWCAPPLVLEWTGTEGPLTTMLSTKASKPVPGYREMMASAVLRCI